MLYFAGTSYGEHQWVNPVLSKVSLTNCLHSHLRFCTRIHYRTFQKVTISASSPLSRFTDPKVLVSRSYQVCTKINISIYVPVSCLGSGVDIRQGTSFAGPRMEDGRNSTWWMVDLGPGHQLMCNYYTVRQDGSRAFMRNWSFEV